MPKLSEARRYMRHNDWELYRLTDHEHYRKRMNDGRYRYTKLSLGNGEIPPPVWRDILRQMGITQEEFNAGL